MNEQIKKLLDQATMDALYETQDAVDLLDKPVTRQQRELQLEKFAELIVAECLAIAKNREDELENANLLKESNAVGFVAYQIARQFGVEE